MDYCRNIFFIMTNYDTNTRGRTGAKQRQGVRSEVETKIKKKQTKNIEVLPGTIFRDLRAVNGHPLLYGQSA